MNYKIGDMLKTKTTQCNSFAYCIITEYRTSDSVNVFWLVESQNVKNIPSFKTWSFRVLDDHFEKVS